MFTSAGRSISSESSGTKSFGTQARSSLGSTEILFENLRSDTRYAAVVRAIDTADNQDDNTVVVEASTRTSFSREVGEVLASAGCTLDFCHSRGSQSGCLNLEDYQDLIDKFAGSTNSLIEGTIKGARQRLKVLEEARRG